MRLIDWSAPRAKSRVPSPLSFPLPRRVSSLCRVTLLINNDTQVLYYMDAVQESEFYARSAAVVLCVCVCVCVCARAQNASLCVAVRLVSAGGRVAKDCYHFRSFCLCASVRVSPCFSLSISSVAYASSWGYNVTRVSPEGLREVAKATADWAGARVRMTSWCLR